VRPVTCILLGLLFVAPPAVAQVKATGEDSLPRPYHSRLIGLPFIGYSTTTRLTVGVAGGLQFKWPGMARDTATKPSYLALSGFYAVKGQWGGFLSTSLYSPASRSWFSGSLSAGYFPVYYYGIGPRTTVADTNRMDQRFIRVEGRALHRMSRQLYLGPAFRLLSVFDVGWQAPGLIPPGLSGGAGGVSSGLGFTTLVEDRNSATTPMRGHYLQVEYLLHGGFVGSDFGYSRLAVDARRYLPVRRGRDVLALAIYGEFNTSGVPIQAMSFIGGEASQSVMRGVYLGRFRDRHELVAQADYRGHLVWRLGYVVFGAAGNVFGSPGNGLLDRAKFTYGAGLRFNVNRADPLNLRVDYTWTSFGGGGLSLGAGEAF
jgi:hypothetical protein